MQARRLQSCAPVDSSGAVTLAPSLPSWKELGALKQAYPLGKIGKQFLSTHFQECTYVVKQSRSPSSTTPPKLKPLMEGTTKSHVANKKGAQRGHPAMH